MSLMLAQTMHLAPLIDDSYVALSTFTNLNQPDTDFGVGCTFNTTGGLTVSGIFSGGTVSQWHFPFATGAGDLYQMRYTLNSGSSLDVGSTGTWLDLSTTRSFFYNTTKSGNFTVEIRNKASTTVLATQTFTMTRS